jgi:CBS domain-containing protein
MKGGMDMSLAYRVIEVFTSEDAKYKGHHVHMAIVQRIRDLHIAARCVVLRGVAGCYESGEIATHGIEVLSFNMPLKIEIVLPASELDRVLPMVEEIVEDGIVLVEAQDMRVHRVSARLLPRNLRVTDIMTHDPRSVTPDTSVAEIVRILLSGTFNAVPVVDANGKPVGMVTQGDLIKRAGMPVRLGLLREMAREHLDATLEELSRKTASDIMSSPVVTVIEHLTVPQAVKVMMDKNLKRVPVTNRDGILTGNLSRLDIFRTVSHETTDWRAIEAQNIEVIGKIRRVGEVVRRDVRAVKPDTPLAEVMRIIDENDIQRVMVVGETGRLIGMIFDRDLLDLFTGHHIGIWDRVASRLTFTAMGQKHKDALEKAAKKTAGEVMKKDLITVNEETTLDDAIRLMTTHQIKLLPVVASDGTLIGVVTRKMLLSLPFVSES